MLAAADGSDALRFVEAASHTIDLLITDAVMPQISGRSLAEQLTRRRPGLKVLFMSGYVECDDAPTGAPRTTVTFLQKPFAGRQLLRTVRDILDRRK